MSNDRNVIQQLDEALRQLTQRVYSLEQTNTHLGNLTSNLSCSFSRLCERFDSIHRDEDLVENSTPPFYQVECVSYEQAGQWFSWSYHERLAFKPTVHAIRYTNGMCWDVINGWRNNS